ncbi:MAG: class I SAM-dependent methyltransferase [Alphaproteobacteria bacterium]|nr:class I SAM-dependent methyltransferase [Alphaproteobacteria bacterium]
MVLGPVATSSFMGDPKRFAFSFSRYKFVNRMLETAGSVVEIGCQEGLGGMVVAHARREYLGLDFFREHIEHALAHVAPHKPNMDFRGHDILDGPVVDSRGEAFDGAFSLDVVEHISPDQEHLYYRHIAESLRPGGIAVIGTPSLESQVHASEASRIGHINCKSGPDLAETCRAYFKTVLSFGMNDEVVHTGFPAMSHYLFAVCIDPR